MDGEPQALTAATLEQGIERHGSAMGRRFGWLFHLAGLGLLLRGLRFEEHSAERIRRASEKGPVVYALYHRSQLDLLALNKALNARRIPLASFVNGMRTIWWLPVPTFWRSVRSRLRTFGQPYLPIESGWLTDLLMAGGHAALFMLGARRIIDRLLRRPEPDVSEALLRAQRRCESSIQVVPVVVAWSRRPVSARTDVERTLLGAEDQPGRFSRLWAALARGGAIIVQAGEPLDLQRFSEQYADEPAARQARILRVALRRYLYREQSIIRGPRTRSHRWMRRLVLSSSAVREAVDHEVRATGGSRDRVMRKVERTFDRIAARMSYRWVQLAALATRLLWNRIYSGIDLRDGDMDLIRQAQRRGGLVLIPCHRSHLDYLLVSSIMHEHDLALPYIAAGVNLSFFPAGPIFRRLGAFFVKRSFRGDRIYPAVFAQYLKQLVREGFPIEFFIEGGRSRTGKLLPPKLGLLSMIVDSMASIRREDFDLTLLPINICYEQLAEERTYARELAGEKKKSESVRDVIRARRVLRHRYGRVYLRVGEPLSLGKALQGLDQPWEELDRDRRGEWLQHVAERILHRINEQAVVLPTSLVALALLAHHRRGIRRTALVERVERFRSFLERAGAKMSASMAWPGWATEEALKRFLDGHKIRSYEDEEGPVYQLAEQSRITLEYYKNSLLHFFVPASLLALCFRHQLRDHGVPRSGVPEGGIPVQELPAIRRFRALAWIFRYEFVFDPETTAGQLADQTMAQLVAHGALQADGEGLRVVDAERLNELAELLLGFVESYWVTLHAAHGLADRNLGSKELVAAIRKVGESIYAVEEIRRAEALSAVSLRNAVRAFREEGLFSSASDDPGLIFDEERYQKSKAFLRELMD